MIAKNAFVRFVFLEVVMRNVNWLAVFVAICFVIGMVCLFCGLLWLLQQALIWILGGTLGW